MPLYALDDAKPELPEEGRYWVAPNAQLIGRVRLGRDVSIWFGTVLRGDNELIAVGEGSNIQENSTLHTDMGYPLVIGAGCTIGHHVMLHGCHLGDNVLIGIGATVLNGARIGNNSLVGAHSLVTEGKVFPDNSLIVGAPARVIRTLDDKAVEGLRGAAASYVKNMQRYTRGLKRLD